MYVEDKVSLKEFNNDILDSARKAFETYGFYKTKIEDIARSLSIGKGTIYRHFGNKLMLFLSVVLHIFEETRIPLEKIRSISSFEKKIDRFIDQAIFMTETSGKFIRVFLEEHLYLMKEPYKDKKIWRYFQYFIEAREYFVLELRDIISQGIKEGKIDDDVDPVLSAELAIMTIISCPEIRAPIYNSDGKKHKNLKFENMHSELKKYVLRSLGYNANRSIK